MFNFLKERDKVNVLAIFYDDKIKGFGKILKQLGTHFISHNNNLTLSYIYSDENNKDRKGKLVNLPDLEIDDFSMVAIHSGKEYGTGNEIRFGFFEQQRRTTVFYCLLPKLLERNVEDIVEIIGQFDTLRFGYTYYSFDQIISPLCYMLDALDSLRTGVDLPASRLTKSKISCYNKNQNLVLDEIIKDVFMINLLSKGHFERIKKTNFYAFLLETEVIIREFDSGVVLFQFSNSKELDMARSIAYAEKIVLCP